MEQALGISIRFDKQIIFSMPRGYLDVKSELLFCSFFNSCTCTHQGLEIDLTAESDAALLQQRRLVDKLPREELEDRWSFSIRLTNSERIHICTQGATYTFIQGRRC